MAKSATDVHEVVMIGAGPSNLAAAIYTTREDIETLILEKGVIGGLAAITDRVENYPGFPDGVGGMELSERLQKQAEKFGAKIDYAEVIGLEDQHDIKKVSTTTGDIYARVVLIGTGNDYRRLDVAGEKELYGRGVHYCATCDGPLYKGRRLVVVGGGNSAAQESLFLGRLVEHIDIFIRKDKWKASEILIKRIDAQPNIKVHFNTEITEIFGKDGLVSGVVATNNQSNQRSKMDVDAVFVFIGLMPNTGFLKNSGVELDERGFIKTNEHLGTNIKGIFAAGDVRAGATEQIASAVGEGAAAALTIREFLDQMPARKHFDTKHDSVKKMLKEQIASTN